MRAFALVMLMLLLSIVLLAGFAVSTAAAETAAVTQAATMEVTCGPASVPPNRYTLVTCTYRVRNTGNERLTSLAIAFNPSNAALPPDQYFFFNETIDGVGQTISGTDLIYTLGGLAVGESRAMELQTVVRSTHEFAAEAMLLADPNQTPLARYTIDRRADATEGPYLPVKFFAEAEGSASPLATEAVYHLRIMNGYDTQFDDLSVDVGSVGDWRLVASPDSWTRDEATGHETRYLGILPASGMDDLGLRLLAPPGTSCAEIKPVVVLRARFRGASVLQPVIADTTSLGACRGVRLSEPSALVDGGFGPAPTTVHLPWVAPLLLMAFGLLLVRAGAALGQRR